MFHLPVRSRLCKRRCVDGYRRSAYPERQSVSFPKREVPIKWLPVDIKHKGSTICTFMDHLVHFRMLSMPTSIVILLQ
ncbi:uncharacterized protein B0T23DRAFT_321028 [Neurospora hispaniola]|uniref:Uncharacterized protein n=1 Tax=Neurospora hispaniola TaxID=588809 RepID=A0AAJ0I3Y7_9PEZI|nr:hypothetical protein B0T23DRAFT_321028 [Neurospora hispaniola]